MKHIFYWFFILILIGCRVDTEPNVIYHHKVIENQEYPITVEEEIFVTNYEINVSYKTNENYLIMPVIESAFLESDCGYFGATKERNLFTINCYSEEFDNFDISHINLLTDIMSQRFSIKITNRNSKYIDMKVILLGGNNRTNQYDIRVINTPNTNTYYYEFIKKAQGITQRASAQFLDNGRKLLLSRGGSHTPLYNFYYTFSLCRVIKDKNSAIYRNEDTGHYVCVYLEYSGVGNGKKLYFISPYNGKFVIHEEIPYDSSVDANITRTFSFQKSLMWSRSKLSGVAGLSQDLINLLYSGSYLYNYTLSINDITSSGYVINKYDWDKKRFWGIVN